MRMPRREPPFEDRYGTFEQRNCFGNSPSSIQNVAEVVTAQSRIRRLGAADTFVHSMSDTSHVVAQSLVRKRGEYHY
jgi:hypothetical protein